MKKVATNTKLNKVCLLCRYKGKKGKVIKGNTWWKHVRKHKGILPPHAVLKK